MTVILTCHSCWHARSTAHVSNSLGINPSEHRQASKLAPADSFKATADEWLELQTKKLSPVASTKAKWLPGLAMNAISSRSIGNLNARELLRGLRKIEKEERSTLGDTSHVHKDAR